MKKFFFFVLNHIKQFRLIKNKNSVFINKKGSTLILLMVIISVVSILLWSLNYTILNRTLIRFQNIPRLKSKLSANSVLSFRLYYLKTALQLDSNNIKAVKPYIMCNVKEREGKVYDNNEFDHYFHYTTFSKCFGSQVVHKSQLFYIKQNYTDYLLSSLGDLFLEGNTDGRFFLGPVMVSENLILKNGGHHFFVKPNWNTNALYIGKDIFFHDKWKNYKNELKQLSQKSFDKKTIDEKKRSKQLNKILSKVSESIDPIFVGLGKFKYNLEYPLTKVYFKVNLQKNWDSIKHKAQENYISLKLPTSKKLSSVAYGALFSTAKSYADEKYIISNLSRHPGKIKIILNPYLLEKELIGFGNGIKRSFYTKKRNHAITRVFLKKFNRNDFYMSSKLKQRKVHPIKDLEGFVNRDFYVYKQTLSFKKSNQKIKLNLPSDSFSIAGKIKYRTPYYSAFSKAREIQSIYIEFLGNFRKLDENDIRFDDENGELLFMSPDFQNKLWKEIGTTDGIRRSYDAPLSMGSIVYLNNKETPARVTPGKVIFYSTPKAGQSIKVLLFKPNIYVKKNPPGYQVGIFIDKEEKVVELKLDELYPPPAYGIIVSDVPLYIHGTPDRKYTILCSKDVYIGSINQNKTKGFPVFIASQQVIWAFQSKLENKTLEINNAILFSAADGFFIHQEVLSNQKINKTQKHLFKGSILLEAKLKNLFYYPTLNEKDGYYYHPGKQADFNFFYDEAFQNHELLPHLLPKSIKMITRKK